jgi:large repetitive protein
LRDAAHPANNFFNSGITDNGTAQTAKSPNYKNQMGFDVTGIKVPAGVIKNNDTSATATLSTNGDGYFPGAWTTGCPLG